LAAIATYPIGARLENNTLPGGILIAEQLLNPLSVRFLAPRDI